VKKKLAVCLRFMIISTLLFVVTSPFIVLYGPFSNIRNTVVGAVGTSMHSYWLRYIMSDAQVDKLLIDAQGSNNLSSSEKAALFANNHSTDIKLTDISSSRFKGYMLEISDPTRIKIGVAKSLGEKGQTTSEIAKDYGAVAAVNGGGFNDLNGTGNGSDPFGIVISNGVVVTKAAFTAPVPLIGLDRQGVLYSGKYTSKQISEMGIKEGVSFYPALILNGKKQITSGDGGWGIAPRTAIGQKADGHILLLVIDGRQPPFSLGATIVDVQNILYQNGAITAANLDGGSSTTMYFLGSIVNSPCDLLGERCIPTAILVI